MEGTCVRTSAATAAVRHRPLLPLSTAVVRLQPLLPPNTTAATNYRCRQTPLLPPTSAEGHSLLLPPTHRDVVE